MADLRLHHFKELEKLIFRSPALHEIYTKECHLQGEDQIHAKSKDALTSVVYNESPYIKGYIVRAHANSLLAICEALN